MIFEGSIQQLKFYLKHLKRDIGITARRIEEIRPGQFRIDTGEETMREIQKNTLEKIRIQRTNFNGHELIDIRVYYESNTGEWKPTKKGIAFSLSLANEVIKGIAEESKKL
jgi:hypothetical protein